jgi:hypothetical protein
MIKEGNDSIWGVGRVVLVQSTTRYTDSNTNSHLLIFFPMPLGVGGAARPLKGERGVGRKCPNAGAQNPEAGEPNLNVACVAGVRNVPEAGVLAGEKKPGDSSRPARVPGKLPVPMLPDGER